VPGLWRNGLHLENAITLFRRLGVDVRLLTAQEFTRAYFQLAKRYHPDRGNPNAHELMAYINAARSAIIKARIFDDDGS
jgi:curved DNA-binding protein CbpA